MSKPIEALFNAEQKRRKSPDRDCPKCAGRGEMKRSIHANFEPCDCTKVQENFKPGEKITFPLIRREGGGWLFSSREGTVVEDAGKKTVTVAMRGRFYYPARQEVRRLNEKSALTEVFEKIADEAGSSTQRPEDAEAQGNLGKCSCGAPARGRMNGNGEARCCATCAFHLEGCRCRFGEGPDVVGEDSCQL